MSETIEFPVACGDKIWTFEGDFIRQRTVGLARVTIIESAGIGDGFMGGGIIANGGENYAPMERSVQFEFMCVETGIGSGSVYRLGEHAFLTEEDCRTANAERIAKREREIKERAEHERHERIRRLRFLKAEIGLLEAKVAAETSE